VFLNPIVLLYYEKKVYILFNQDQADLNEIKINENNEKYIQRCLKYMNLVWSISNIRKNKTCMQLGISSI
jgi:hypothetical protein